MTPPIALQITRLLIGPDRRAAICESRSVEPLAQQRTPFTTAADYEAP